MTLTSSSKLLIFLLSSLWMLQIKCAAQPQPPSLDCDPCIKRSQYTLQAILHGTSSDIFWLEMQASMRQAAVDMGVSLTIELSEVFNAQVMAQQIKNAAASSDIDALIVTIPNDIVQEAVAQVIADGMPVFGVNVGYEVAQELGILGYAAQNDYLAGQQAGQEFLVGVFWRILFLLLLSDSKSNKFNHVTFFSKRIPMYPAPSLLTRIQPPKPCKRDKMDSRIIYSNTLEL